MTYRRHLLAENDGLLSIDPNPNHVAVVVVIVVAGGADSHPQKPDVGQKRPDTKQPTGSLKNSRKRGWGR